MKKRYFRISVGVFLSLGLMVFFQNCKEATNEISALPSLITPTTPGTTDPLPNDNVPVSQIDLSKLISISVSDQVFKSGNHLVLTESGEVFVESPAGVRLQTILFSSPKAGLSLSNPNKVKLSYGGAKIPSGWSSLTAPPSTMPFDSINQTCLAGYVKATAACNLSDPALVLFPKDNYCQYSGVDCAGNLVPIAKDPDCESYSTPSCNTNTTNPVMPPNPLKVADRTMKIFSVPERTTNFGNVAPGLGIIQIDKPVSAVVPPDPSSSYELSSNSDSQPLIVPSGTSMAVVPTTSSQEAYYYEGQALSLEPSKPAVKCQDGSLPVQKLVNGIKYGVCTPEVATSSTGDSCPNLNYSLEIIKTKTVDAPLYTTPITWNIGYWKPSPMGYGWPDTYLGETCAAAAAATGKSFYGVNTWSYSGPWELDPNGGSKTCWNILNGAPGYSRDVSCPLNYKLKVMAPTGLIYDGSWGGVWKYCCQWHS